MRRNIEEGLADRLLLCTRGSSDDRTIISDDLRDKKLTEEV